MNRLHTFILSGGLVLSPLLITAEELVRLSIDNEYVENDSDPVADSASHLQVVADHLAGWHLAAYLDLGYLITWAIAFLAVTVLVARSRPVLAALTGMLGLVSTVGIAMHWTFYYLPLASLAQAADRDMAARAASTFGDDVLLAIALVMFLLGTLAAVLVGGFSLWRAHVLRWWAAVGLAVWLGYVFVGSEARLSALLNLALLLPFIAVARALTPGERVVDERVPASA
jgi:hypothetical protein